MKSAIYSASLVLLAAFTALPIAFSSYDEQGCRAPFTACLEAAVLNLPEKALKEQFPSAKIKRRGVFLSKKRKKELENKLGFRIRHRFHTFYIAREDDGKLVGYGIFDTHRVRTKQETLFIVFNPDGRVKHVEVIAFHEPDEYMAPRRWFRLFQGRIDGFRPGSGIPVISGATLTTHAASRSIRLARLLQNFHFGQ